MFNQVLNVFTAAISEVGTTIVNIFTSIAKIFYDNGFTFPGVLLLIGIAISLIIIGIDFLLSLAGVGIGGSDDEDI